MRGLRSLRSVLGAAVLAVLMAASVALAVHVPKAQPGTVTAKGVQLRLDGKPWRFVGVDAYSATTWYPTNWGCGSPISDLERLFRSLPRNGVVRVWAFQALGWNNKVTPGRIDFTAIDRVVHAAERTGRKVELVLSDQAGTCDDGHWHGQAWYDGGYRRQFTDDGRGLGDRSFLAWVRTTVPRYAHSKAVAFWEPVNEPEASDCRGAAGPACWAPSARVCRAGAARTLRQFFDTVGGLIHRLDPHHLVAEGLSGGSQCGVAGDDFLTLARSRGVDVLTYHDYGAQTVGLPAGLRARLAQARRAGKPLIVEEAGISAGAPGNPCSTWPYRALVVANKARRALSAGAAGWMPWWYTELPAGECGDDLGPGDPSLRVLGRVLAHLPRLRSAPGG